MTDLEKAILSGLFIFTGMTALGTIGIWTYLISKYDN